MNNASFFPAQTPVLDMFLDFLTGQRDLFLIRRLNIFKSFGDRTALIRGSSALSSMS